MLSTDSSLFQSACYYLTIACFWFCHCAHSHINTVGNQTNWTLAACMCPLGGWHIPETAHDRQGHGPPEHILHFCPLSGEARMQQKPQGAMLQEQLWTNTEDLVTDRNNHPTHQTMCVFWLFDTEPCLNAEKELLDIYVCFFAVRSASIWFSGHILSQTYIAMNRY